MTSNDVEAQGTYLVAMDSSNVRELRRRFGRDLEVARLLDYAAGTEERNVPDPYYSGNFDYVFELVEDGCRGLLDFIRRQEGL